MKNKHSSTVRVDYDCIAIVSVSILLSTVMSFSRYEMCNSVFMLNVERRSNYELVKNNLLINSYQRSALKVRLLD